MGGQQGPGRGRGPLAPPLRRLLPLPQPLPSPSLLPPPLLTSPGPADAHPYRQLDHVPQGLALLWAGGQEGAGGWRSQDARPVAAAPPTHLSGPVDGQADGDCGDEQDAQRVPVVVVGQPQRDAEGLEPIVRVQCLGGWRGGSVRAQGPRGGPAPERSDRRLQGWKPSPPPGRSRPTPLAMLPALRGHRSAGQAPATHTVRLSHEGEGSSASCRCQLHHAPGAPRHGG